ncbi:hypothetical protein V8E36_002209 [Tilletia maclaganii]
MSQSSSDPGKHPAGSSSARGRGGAGHSKPAASAGKKKASVAGTRSLQAIQEADAPGAAIAGPSGTSAGSPAATGADAQPSAAAGGGQAAGSRAVKRTTQQIVDEKLAAAEKELKQKMDEQKRELENTLSNRIDEKLQTYQETLEQFAVEERLVTLEDGQPSRLDAEKVVIVVNALKLDELRQALRAHRTHNEDTKRLESRLQEVEDQLKVLFSLAAGGAVIRKRLEPALPPGASAPVYARPEGRMAWEIRLLLPVPSA